MSRLKTDNIAKDGFKLCIRCKKILPVDNFYKDTYKEDGLRIYCKSCCKKSKKKYRSNEKLYLIRVMLSMLEPIRNKKIQSEEVHSIK